MGTTWSESVKRRTHRAISSIRYLRILGVAGREKRNEQGSGNPTERKESGGTEEKEMRHVPPGLLALRLRSTPTLVPRFGVDPACMRIAIGPSPLSLLLPPGARCSAITQAFDHFAGRTRSCRATRILVHGTSALRSTYGVRDDFGSGERCVDR